MKKPKFDLCYIVPIILGLTAVTILVLIIVFG